MIELNDSILWIKLPMYTEEANEDHINTYLIRGEKGHLLVDSGWNTDESLSILRDRLAVKGITLGDISQIVVTHIHPDHYGMAGRIKQLSGATLAFHYLEQESIESRYIHPEKFLNQTDQLLMANGVPRDEIASLRDATKDTVKYVVPVFPDITLHDGDTVSTGEFTFRVIHTPGHANGHLCLYEPNKKILLSGDHILPKITPNISLHPQSIDNPLGKYINSLKKIRSLDVELTLPGHNGPFTKLVSRIDFIIKHHARRNQEILTALQQETKTAYELTQQITWKARAKWHTLHDFHRRMAICETLAHLEMMVTEGRLDVLTRKGIRYYRQK
jgi:glyoxylase-like metal-dependent hydrolase (beta-lactamase superfamily II)